MGNVISVITAFDSSPVPLHIADPGYGHTSPPISATNAHGGNLIHAPINSALNAPPRPSGIQYVTITARCWGPYFPPLSVTNDVDGALEFYKAYASMTTEQWSYNDFPPPAVLDDIVTSHSEQNGPLWIPTGGHAATSGTLPAFTWGERSQLPATGIDVPGATPTNYLVQGVIDDGGPLLPEFQETRGGLTDMAAVNTALQGYLNAVDMTQYWLASPPVIPTVWWKNVVGATVLISDPGNPGFYETTPCPSFDPVDTFLSRFGGRFQPISPDGLFYPITKFGGVPSSTTSAAQKFLYPGAGADYNGWGKNGALDGFAFAEANRCQIRAIVAQSVTLYESYGTSGGRGAATAPGVLGSLFFRTIGTFFLRPGDILEIPAPINTPGPFKLSTPLGDVVCTYIGTRVLQDSTLEAFVTASGYDPNQVLLD